MRCMSNPLANEEFARVFAAHHRRIFSYVRSLVPNHADAEEVFQETCVVLWHKFEDYDRDREFAPWALAVAHNQIRTWRHQKRRQSKVMFSDTLLEDLANEEAAVEEQLARQSEVLSLCVNELRLDDRDLINQFYGSGETAKALAERLGRPANTVYKALGRIRSWLHECVRRKLAADERSI